MNHSILQGNWKELKGKVKQQWGKLTDDDLLAIEGKTEEIYGKLQKHYGYSKEQAEEELTKFKQQLDSEVK